MAINQSTVNQVRPTVKQINYLSKTFSDFRQNLIEFAKAYYPNSYSDFNETSPGMMFIEMASYVGDVLSFYIDNAFKENLLAYAEQQDNIITLSQFLGYKPKLTSAATTTATLYQTVEALLVGAEYVPNPKYLLKIQKGSTFISNESSLQFTLVENVDFGDITSEDYTIDSLDAGGLPSSFLVSKTAKLIACQEQTQTFSFGSPQKFSTIQLSDDNIIGIVDVRDSSNNKWYEVDYLAQDTIMEDLEISDNGEVGLMPAAKLRYKKVPRRFVTRVNRNLKTELVFGSGTENDAELDLVLDSRQIANQQYGSTIQNILANTSINNVNYLNSSAFGVAPTNTTLTVTYWVGGGVDSNTPSNTIVNVGNIRTYNDISSYTAAEINKFNNTVTSLSVNNENPATGGGAGETLDEIKQNALAFFNAQNRVVTAEDYTTRAYSLPSRYGRISKAYAIRDEQINRIQSLNDDTYVDNPVRPNSINLYVLGYDTNGKLSTLNTLVKENLEKYLEQYRMLTDDVNILDAFIINIGVRFRVTVFRNYNVNDVIARCIGEIQTFFDISRWTIGQPIILSELTYILGLVDGVQTVNELTIFNKYQFNDGEDYQNYRYDIQQATVGGVIYPSLDPSIFELKNPSIDIIGNAIQ